MTSGARLFWNVLFVLGGDGLLVGSCIFAWLRGGAAERVGATLYFASAVAAGALAMVMGKSLPGPVDVFIDAAVAVGFLLLAIRYNKLWLGAAMLAKGAQLALYATHLTDLVDAHIGPFNLYAVSLDAVADFISVILILATVAAMRARRKPGPPIVTATPVLP